MNDLNIQLGVLSIVAKTKSDNSLLKKIKSSPEEVLKTLKLGDIDPNDFKAEVLKSLEQEQEIDKFASLSTESTKELDVKAIQKNPYGAYSGYNNMYGNTANQYTMGSYALPQGTYATTYTIGHPMSGYSQNNYLHNYNTQQYLYAMLMNYGSSLNPLARYARWL